MKKKKNKSDCLLTKAELRQRGWTGIEIYNLLPKPVYVNGIPKWKLSDAEKIESSIDFYIEVN